MIIVAIVVLSVAPAVEKRRLVPAEPVLATPAVAVAAAIEPEQLRKEG
jgi:hypothetical protein